MYHLLYIKSFKSKDKKVLSVNAIEEFHQVRKEKNVSTIATVQEVILEVKAQEVEALEASQAEAKAQKVILVSDMLPKRPRLIKREVLLKNAIKNIEDND